MFLLNRFTWFSGTLRNVDSTIIGLTILSVKIDRNMPHNHGKVKSLRDSEKL